jgi:hypothetical protein
MKHETLSRGEKSPVIQPPQKSNADQADFGFSPSPDEVAREAYFTYLNEGSPEGLHVQHWLDAEARLIKDRDRTRVHGFHNRT